VPRGHDVLCVDAMREDSNVYTQQFKALLEKLPNEFANAQSHQAAGGAALKAATELAAAQGGGHVIMFHATLPNTGVGALRARDDIKLYGSPEGGGLFTPQQAPFYEEVTKECLAKGVAVSVFCCPEKNVYLDVATLSLVPRRTGGEVIHIQGFHHKTHGEQLHYSLARMVRQDTVFSCVFKLRCSKGLNIEHMYATWDAEVIDQSTFHVSRMSTDSTAVFHLSHGERIEGQKHVYMQAACLHTNKQGQRLIRVHTLQLQCTNSLSNVFRYTEVDCVTSLLLKQATNYALQGNASFKDKLTKDCVDMLYAYRVHCASTTSSGQLILPESLKLLPLFVCAIRKMAIFRSGSDLRVDDRMAGLIRLLGLPIAHLAPLVYPRVYTLMPLGDQVGKPTGVGDNVHMPPTIACTDDKLATDRIFLIDNGLALYIYVREHVQPETLQQALGVSTAGEVADAVASFNVMAPATEDGRRIWQVVQQLRRERYRLPWQSVFVATHGTPEEARVLALLVEDRVAGEMQYVDFLCHVHKQVQLKLE